MIKRTAAFLISVILAVTISIPIAVAAPQEVSIVIDGDKITPAGAGPEIVNDRVFVPLRLISENIGIELEWDGSTNTVSAQDKFTHVVGTSYVTLANGNKIDIGVESYIKNASTMVSARMIAEALGCSVDWNSTNSTVIITTPGANGTTIKQTVADSDKTDILSTIKGLNFVFSSGAGGWSTDVQIQEDGYFIGYYHDSEMGSMGEDYPNGTLYECYFEGRFTVNEKIDDLTYSLQLEEFTTHGVIDEEKIVNGVKIVTTDAYGFDNADEFMLYLPGRSTADLDAELLDWVLVGADIPSALPFYCLYNVGGQQGFSSWNALSTS